MLKKSPWALVLILIFPLLLVEAILEGWRGDGIRQSLHWMWGEYKWFWRELVDEEE